MHTAYVVEFTIIAFCYETVDGACRDSYIFVLFQHIFCQGIHSSAYAESICHDNRCFDTSQFFNLNKTGTFAETVDD